MAIEDGLAMVMALGNDRHWATIKCGFAMATALGNDRIIGSPALAGKTASTRKVAPVKAAKLRLWHLKKRKWSCG